MQTALVEHKALIEAAAATSPATKPNVDSELALLYPGQGSQRAGMGANLFPLYPELVAQASEVLGYSIAELCLENPEARLSNTLYAQPAVYFVNALHTLAFQAESRRRPAVICGHSLGEYNALHAAGAFDLLDGLTLVAHRAQCMATVANGGMAVVTGLTGDAIEAELAAIGVPDVYLANNNSDTQVVLAGTKAQLAAVGPRLKRAGAKHVLPLNVSGPFHSPLMDSAHKAFKPFLQKISLKTLSCKVISNVTARPFDVSSHVFLLSDHLIAPVQWAASIRRARQLGVVEFLEIGGTTLTKMNLDIAA